MKKISKYKKQIVTLVTILLLVTCGIFPALSAANTLLNLVGGIGALVLLLWAGLELKDYVILNEIQSSELTNGQSEKIVSDIENKELYTRQKSNSKSKTQKTK